MPHRCAVASHGTLYGLAARGDRLAILFGYGVENHRGTDEPSTVMMLELQRGQRGP
ncbi:MAG: hypothetical protein ACM31C_24160 [Acidobacteriota bacterium]